MFCENVAVRLVMDNNCVNNTLTAVVVFEVVVDVVGVVVSRHHRYAGHLCTSGSWAGGWMHHPTLHHGGVLNMGHQKGYGFSSSFLFSCGFLIRRI